MEKLAIFDFCGTITDFQTFDPFLESVIIGENIWFKRWVGNKYLKRLSGHLSRLKKGFYLYKRLLIRSCKGVPEVKIKAYARAYYQERVKPHCIPAISEKIRSLQNEGYRVIILSAGSKDYICEYAKEMSINDIIANEFDVKDGLCTGKLMDKDCLRKEKVSRLMRYIRENEIEGELLVGFSDSKSDMPFLNLCKRKVIVSHKIHRKWVCGDMEEIIWD